MFSAQTYRARRQALRRRVARGLALIVGHEDSPICTPTNYYPFRQDSSFLYFFGISAPGWIGLIDLDDEMDWLFCEEPSVESFLHGGSQPTLREWAALAGVNRLGSLRALTTRLHTAIASKRPIHYLRPYRAQTLLRLSTLVEPPIDVIPSDYSQELSLAVIEGRSHKEPQEVAQIELALDASAKMHRLALEHTRPGVNARELVGKMEGLVRELGLEPAYRMSYAQGGPWRSESEVQQVLGAGRLVVNDAAAVSPFGYAAHMVRTLPVNGRFSPAQAELYAIVEAAHRAMLQHLRAGVAFSAVHDRCMAELVDGLRKLAVFRGDTDDVIESGAYAIVFPVGAGHHLGLDVHDMEAIDPDLVGYGHGECRSELFGRKNLKLGRRVDAGFVLAIESGLYFIPEVIARWREEGRFADLINYAALEKLSGVGTIRMDDVVLVSEEGARQLGPVVPRTMAAIEGAMGRRLAERERGEASGDR